MIFIVSLRVGCDAEGQFGIIAMHIIGLGFFSQVLFEEGMELFKEGLLRPSYEKFNGATDLVPVRSKVSKINISVVILMWTRHHTSVDKASFPRDAL